VDENDERRAVEPSEVPAEEPTAEPTAEAAPPRREGRERRGPRNRDARLRSGVDSSAPFPEEARERGVETNCQASLRIDANGRVAEIEAIRCGESGLGFEDSLRRQIEREFRFDPQIEDGEPVERRLRWEHRFRLDE
jgi:hypothetical protein